ncbi:MAG: hypothetical protein LC799_04270 [Actinobacteria bacterium]|nr:hypothetical protein [Actinomycetota bacterium]
MIARAYLEGLLEKATNEGGFKGGLGLHRDWQKLGTETKKVLFRNPALVRDLDHFFLLAKRLDESPNPSGSTLTAVSGLMGGLLWTDPVSGATTALTTGALSQMLHAPKVVKALNRYLSPQTAPAPVRRAGGPHAATAVQVSEVVRAAREAGLPLEAAPAEADP